MPVIDFAPTRIFHQAHQARTPRPVRQTRTPVREQPAAARPEPRSGPLPHPRLVRRTRPPTSSDRDREFEDAPTDERR